MGYLRRRLQIVLGVLHEPQNSCIFHSGHKTHVKLKESTAFCDRIDENGARMTTTSKQTDRNRVVITEKHQIEGLGIGDAISQSSQEFFFDHTSQQIMEILQ